MPGEREIIDIMNALLPQGRLNRSHEFDCEVFNLNGKPGLFTTMNFQPRTGSSKPIPAPWAGTLPLAR